LSISVLSPNGFTSILNGSQIQNATSSSAQIVSLLNLAGTYSLQIVNPNGQQSNHVTFLVRPAAPTVTSISPFVLRTSSAPQSLTITGAKLPGRIHVESSHSRKSCHKRTVSRVLAPGVPRQRWYSVAGVLTVLAEAAPQAFLAGLQAQLAPAAPECFGSLRGGWWFLVEQYAHHLSWALEILAWDPLYLGAVTLLLVVSRVSIRGRRLQNRPINSLREYSCSGIPTRPPATTPITRATSVEAPDQVAN
jgi:hypothetical protein